MQSGDSCSIIGKDSGGGACAAPSPQDYKVLMNAVSERDFATLEKLMNGNLMFALTSGVKVKVLDADGSLTKIVVLQGRNSGEELWLKRDRLRKEPASGVGFSEVWKPEEVSKVFAQLESEIANEHFEAAAERASELVMLVPEGNKELRRRVIKLREAFCNVAGTDHLRRDARRGHTSIDDSLPAILRDKTLEKTDQEFQAAAERLLQALKEFEALNTRSPEAFWPNGPDIPLPAPASRISLKKGDRIVLPSGRSLYFHGNFYRVGQAGERFQVIEYRRDTRKLYLLSKDKDGNSIALNIPDAE